jgi:hypothetical protein
MSLPSQSFIPGGSIVPKYFGLQRVLQIPLQGIESHEKRILRVEDLVGR